ncbi:MAG: hypothetical protein DRJ08_06255 [Acidobacteria bacterium]|nr:MAG: hypothetical protein DRJ14_00995 [Acidobacteriota bacterium]RLE20976.1 MAG: hypothetical protein DRJ08_06255 [Acidobacteriota bacterium]
MLETNVFKRVSGSGALLSDGLYNLAIGVVLCWGFLVNWWLVKNVNPAWLRSINTWVFFLGYFGCCFLGVMLFNKSDNPFISFIGYNFVVVPFGLVVNMIVSLYNPSVVGEAIRVTAFVTVGMMILGVLFPSFFQKIIGALTVALIIVIIIEAVQVFFMHIHQNWLDWAVAVIFCGYIGYDWGRANQIPKTLDNAVDSAAALYMDIINLFIRILSILGRRD